MKPNRLKKAARKRNIFSIVKKVGFLSVTFTIAIALYLYLYSHPIGPIFPLQQIAFEGNKHLSDDELITLSGLSTHESLFRISNEKISQRLLLSPWITAVALRKQFPDTLSVTIKEAEPFALLDVNEHLFLIDDRGKLLEELKDDSIPFLPVIKGDPFQEKEGLLEALNLIKFMNVKGIFIERDHVEIVAHKPHEITLTVEGMPIRVGAGGYEEKLERLIRLEEDIKKMGVPIEYIDLRFENRAIVKPITEKVIE
jgi:cell division protein FtsQ